MNANLFSMGRKLKWSIAGVVLEGLLCSANFLVLLQVLELIFHNQAEFSKILRATAVLACSLFFV